MEVNCYVLASARDRPAIIIDPGDEENKIRRVLDDYKLKAAMVINTHGHFDHIGCDDKFAVPIYIHSLDAKMLRDAKSNFSIFFVSPYKVNSEIKTLQDQEVVKLEDIELQVLHTPGHTPGGTCLLMKHPNNKILFTGDSLFCQGIGRTDLGGNESLLISSIKEKLFILPNDTVIYPGHGPSSTIGDEKSNNPFFK
jgi:glyoxylase-like metal-dependent hydrolase (beta-lactamase superfamily II)